MYVALMSVTAGCPGGLLKSKTTRMPSFSQAVMDGNAGAAAGAVGAPNRSSKSDPPPPPLDCAAAGPPLALLLTPCTSGALGAAPDCATACKILSIWRCWMCLADLDLKSRRHVHAQADSMPALICLLGAGGAQPMITALHTQRKDAANTMTFSVRTS